MILHMPKPSSRQAEFFKAAAPFIMYGGARGGGKTWALRHKAALMALYYQGIRIIILRRTYPELKGNHILPMMAECAGVATYKDTDKAMIFPGGSRVEFGYCDSDADVLRYQGQEYDIIMLDEATQIPYEWFIALTACIRGVNNFPKRMYLTCNPGGVGHEWVKRLFVDRQYRGDERPKDYIFIPAKATDNTALMESNPRYMDMLNNLPDDLRRAWRDGQWDVFAGQYFAEWDPAIHTIEPMDIPPSWRRYVAIDYGLDMLAAYWIAVDESGHAVVYREYTEGMDMGDGHTGLIVSEAAEAIKARTLQGEMIHQYIAPPDLWGRKSDTGRSTAEIFLQHGIRLTKACNDRVMGWMDLHEWLSVSHGGPALKVSKACHNLIKWMPLLQHDTKNPDDCANTPHQITHGPDAIRYFVAGRPRPNKQPVKPAHYNFSCERPKHSPGGYGDKIKVV